MPASFGVKAGEGGVNAFTVVGVGVRVFACLEGALVAAGPAEVGAVQVAAWVIADKSLAFGTASGHVINVADVAPLWGALLGLL